MENETTTHYTICPNTSCNAIWSLEEIDFQACDSCGYPLKDEVFDFSKEE